MEERIFKELVRLFTASIIWGFLMWGLTMIAIFNIEDRTQTKLDKIEQSINKLNKKNSINY